MPNTIDDAINMSDYQEIIDHVQIFEQGVEIIPDPIIYEVPIDIIERAEHVEIGTQV